jgi:hypothetical protein
MTASGLMSSLQSSSIGLDCGSARVERARRPGLVADGPTHPTQGMHRTSAVQVPIKTAFRRSQQPVVGVGVLESKDQEN